MTNRFDRYAVIGNPVAHSKSPEIHASFAAQTQQHLVYERLQAPLDGFADSVRRFVREGGCGANVTVPFKQEAHALSDVLTDRARAAGAVNTLKFESGRILGDNTDGVGLVTDIVRNAGVTIKGKSILLLGAGGAARGVILPLLAERPASLTIANRTVSKAFELAHQFSTQHCKIQASEFLELRSSFDIVINATSASLADDVPPISPKVFGAGSLAYDMMYGRDATVFMLFARQHGAEVRDGLGMLVEQAAESFFLWRKIRPGTRDILTQLRAKL